MSDKRTTYAIGAIVVAFALVLGTVAGSTSLTPISVTSQDPMQMTGHVILTLTDADGDIKAYRQTDNIIVRNGMDCSADLLFGDETGTGLCDPAAFFTSIAIGSSDASVDISQSTLTAEVTSSTPARNGTLSAEVAATVSVGAKKSVEGTFNIGGSFDVKEVGLFDDASSNSGNMFSRILIIPTIPVLSGDTVKITYVVTVG